MSHDSPPHGPTGTDADPTAAPRTAAEHYAAAEALFARAREIYPNLGDAVANENEYRRCMDWAGMHLRLAEIRTAGAALVATHLRLRADNIRMINAHIGSEAHQWNELIGHHHGKPRRTA